MYYEPFSVLNQYFQTLSSMENAEMIIAQCEMEHVVTGGNVSQEHAKALLAEREKRKHLYPVLHSVLRELGQRCPKMFIAVKGVYTAEDLYPDPYVRKVRDIDILTRPKDAGKVFHALLDMGFTCQYSYDFALEEIRKEHIQFYGKEDGEDITVEVHGAELNPAGYYPAYLELLFSRSEVYRDTGVLIPGIYDRFLHSLLHFDIHLRDYLIDEYIKEVEISLNIKDLLDNALLLYKYGDLFDWQFLHNVIEEIGAEEDAAIALSVFNRIFPSDLPTGFIESLHQLGGQSRLLEKTAFLIPKILNLQDFTDLFGDRLKDFVRICGRDICDEIPVCRSGRMDSDAFRASLFRAGDKILLQTAVCLYPLEIEGTRFKVYVFTDDVHPAVKVLRFTVCGEMAKVCGDNIDISSTKIHYEFSKLDDYSYLLQATIPADLLKINSDIVYMNLAAEYSIGSQYCVFGSLWTEMGTWRPVILEEFRPTAK